jgi:hypothetical protein
MHVDLASLVAADEPLQAYRVTLISDTAATTAAPSSSADGVSSPVVTSTPTSSTQQCVFTTPLETYLQPGCEPGLLSASILPVESATCERTFPLGASCSVVQKTTELRITSTSRITKLSIQVEKGATRYAAVVGPISYEDRKPDGDSCPGSCTLADVSTTFTSLIATEQKP